jgi:hypothetical protein
MENEQTVNFSDQPNSNSNGNFEKPEEPEKKGLEDNLWPINWKENKIVKWSFVAFIFACLVYVSLQFLFSAHLGRPVIERGVHIIFVRPYFFTLLIKFVLGILFVIMLAVRFGKNDRADKMFLKLFLAMIVGIFLPYYMGLILLFFIIIIDSLRAKKLPTRKDYLSLAVFLLTAFVVGFGIYKAILFYDRYNSAYGIGSCSKMDYECVAERAIKKRSIDICEYYIFMNNPEFSSWEIEGEMLEADFYGNCYEEVLDKLPDKSYCPMFLTERKQRELDNYGNSGEQRAIEIIEKCEEKFD